MRKLWLSALLVAVALASVQPAVADEGSKIPPPEPPKEINEDGEEVEPGRDEIAGWYVSNVFHKFFRGCANTAFGWVEIPVQTYREGSFRGFLHGTRDFVLRTGCGIADIVTCPFPWPDRFRPIMMPEFPGGPYPEEEDEEPDEDTLEAEKPDEAEDETEGAEPK
jgi:putative exosortase-associated protein (TIGR04073 family)